MDELEETLSRIRRAEAISHAGVGTNHENSNFLRLIIYSSNLVANLSEREFFTFQVCFQGYITKNGNVSHRIEIVEPFTKVLWQEPKALKGKTIIANSEGTLNKFSFTMKREQLKHLEMTSSGSRKCVQLLAEQKYKGIVQIIWLENDAGANPESTKRIH